MSYTFHTSSCNGESVRWRVYFSPKQIQQPPKTGSKEEIQQPPKTGSKEEIQQPPKTGSKEEIQQPPKTVTVGAAAAEAAMAAALFSLLIKYSLPLLAV